MARAGVTLLPFLDLALELGSGRPVRVRLTGGSGVKELVAAELGLAE